MWRKRRTLSREQEIANAINNCVTSIIERYKNTPIKVNHSITRNIPRPTMIEFIIQRADGQRYNLGAIDLSYRTHKEIVIHPQMLSDEIPNSLPAFRIMLNLHYDPSDRH
jgi:hypothetical protein